MSELKKLNVEMILEEEEVETPAPEESKDESVEEAEKTEEVAETPSEEKKSEEEVVEKAEESVEEVKEETKEDSKTEEEIVKELAEEVADKAAAKVLKKLQLEKEAVKSNKVEKSIMSQVKVKDVQIDIYKKKSGKAIQLEKHGVNMLAKWFSAWAEKDFSEARKLAQEIDTKFEPLVVGTASEGGYLAPQIWTSILINIRNDRAVIRPNASMIDLSGAGSEFKFNQIASQPRLSWSGEAVAKSTTSITFNQGSLTPYKLAGIVSVSLELLQDSATSILPLIMRQMADAMAKEEDRVFMVGTGTNQPTGIDAYSLTTVDAAFNLSYNTFVKAYYRLPQAYRESAKWIMNSRAIVVARSLTDSNNRPLFLEGSTDALTGRPVSTILGAPVLEQNDVASSKIFFGDVSQYYIGDKMGMTMRTSTEATVAGNSAFEKNLTHVLVEERVDGELLDTRAFVEISNVNAS